MIWILGTWIFPRTLHDDAQTPKISGYYQYFNNHLRKD